MLRLCAVAQDMQRTRPRPPTSSSSNALFSKNYLQLLDRSAALPKPSPGHHQPLYNPIDLQLSCLSRGRPDRGQVRTIRSRWPPERRAGQGGRRVRFTSVKHGIHGQQAWPHPPTCRIGDAARSTPAMGPAGHRAGRQGAAELAAPDGSSAVADPVGTPKPTVSGTPTVTGTPGPPATSGP